MKHLIPIGVLAICSYSGTAVAGTSFSWADAGFAANPGPMTVDRDRPQSIHDFSPTSISIQTSAPSGTATSPTRVQPKAISTIADLAGNYVMTSTSCVGYGNPGREVSISPVAGTDSIAIDGFWSAGIIIKAKVDLKTSSVTIPCQYMYTHSAYGPMDLSAVATNGVPLRNEPIVGTINPDGTIGLDTWWCVAVRQGDDKDEIVDANRATLFERPNATMTYKFQGAQPVTFGVVANQSSSNVVSVKNFANRGATIEISLNGERSGIIASQTVYITSEGSWMTVGNPSLNDAGQLVTYSPAIPLNVAPDTDKHTISWGNWAMYLPQKKYSGLIESGSVTTDFDIVYPPKASATLSGSGTEADPYKIANVSDMILLAQMVNTDQDRSGSITSGNQTVTYARSQRGKFFKMTSDIDMGGYRANSIGWDMIHQFAGTFDGAGHTITGLNVESAGFAGLFGMVDTLGVIKNIIIDAPTITSTSSYYAAAVAAYSQGLISNCNVNKPTVNQNGQVAAGIVGIGRNVENCNVTGANIFARYGFAAGVAGQINGTISNCSATDCYITGSASASADPRMNGGTPIGGVVGSLFGGTAVGCSFTGMVDGYSLGISLYAGGIAGINHLGLIDRCLSAGSVLGFGAGSVNGGIAGFCTGRIINSYSAGLVDCVSSYYTGGITGRLSIAESSSPQPEVISCYTTAQVRAESYQYQPAEEMRETIGKIWAGTTPRIENVYFDNQIVNFRSERGGLTNAALTSGTPVTGLDSSVWTYTPQAYPRLTLLAASKASELSASAILMPQGATTLMNINEDLKLSALGDTKFSLLNAGKLSDTGHFCSIAGDSLIINKEYRIGNDTIVADNGDSRLYYYIKVAPKFLDGEGSEESPYLIRNKADLLALAEATSAKELVFANTWFALTNDIDLENDPAFQGISFTSKTTLRFAGTIDGRGYAIHNMKLDFVKWATPPTDTTLGELNSSGSVSYVGFVSKLAAAGVIKNLTIAEDCSIQGLGTVGAIVGTSYGMIENCRNFAPVTALATGAGGIAGKLESGSKAFNCFNGGHIVTGYQGAGGIAGAGTSCQILGCANTGLIEAKALCTARPAGNTSLKYAGGIAGNFTGTYTIADCADYGHSFAEYATVASICARAYGTATLTNNLALGTLRTNDVVAIGTMAGEIPSKPTWTDNLWDAQMLPWKAGASQNMEGAEGVSTESLTSGEALAQLPDSLWSYAKGRYPILKAFVDIPVVQAAALAYFNLPKGESVGDMSSNVTLPSTDNRVWSLEPGSKFSLSGNTLDVPQATKELMEGTLSVTVNAIYSKPFYLSVLPGIPFQGKGTAEEPYLIRSAQEWNALSVFMESTGQTFEGKYLKVTSDIDFSTEKSLAIAADGKTSFEGTLDGDNHTLKNISLSGATQYMGLIGSLGEQGCIRNLTFSGSVNSTGLNAGGVVGKSAGRFENCISEMEVSSNKLHTGGFAGLVTGGAFRNCTSRATVSSTSTNVGGFIGQGTGRVALDSCVFEGNISCNSTSTGALNYGGFIGNAWNSDFTACVNKGKFTNLPERANGIGGFIGNANGAVGNGAYTFTDCRNESDITAGNGVAGFVFTAVATTGAAPMTFTRCENIGKISITYSSTKAAGFVCNITPGSSFTDCVNRGEISSIGGITAGIVAMTAGTFNTDNQLTFTNCSNEAPIISQGNNTAGIIGQGGNFTVLKDCSNTGTIQGAIYTGGIVGQHTAVNLLIENCWNSGDITVKGGRAGGIIGSMSGNAAKQGDILVKGCFNTGTITTTSTLGGTSVTASNPSGYAIGGLAGFTNGRFENSYNMGEVKGVSRIGGLVGDPGTNKKFSMAGCYNAGIVTAPADTCGAIVGINTENGKLWTEGAVENSFYLAGCAASTLPVQGKEVSVKELCKLSISDSFVAPAANCFPVVKALEDVEIALLYSAQPVFGDGQSADNVTGPFMVGTPENLVWSISGLDATISNGEVRFNETFRGDALLNKSIGDLSIEIPLKLDVQVTSLDELTSEKEIVSRLYFTPDGIQTAEPTPGDGALYIVVISYADGTSRSVRLLNK